MQGKQQTAWGVAVGAARSADSVECRRLSNQSRTPVLPGARHPRGKTLYLRGVTTAYSGLQCLETLSIVLQVASVTTKKKPPRGANSRRLLAGDWKPAGTCPHLSARSLERTSPGEQRASVGLTYRVCVPFSLKGNTMAGYYDLKRSGEQYMFNLRGANNEVVLTSERYVSKQSAVNGIAAVKANSPSDSQYRKLTNTGGQPYFTLKGGNGETIGTSESYSSTTARDNGITWVKTNGPGAPTQDNT
jgi:uncharacterized protein